LKANPKRGERREETCQRKMGLDRLEVDRVMYVVRESVEKGRGTREKVKEPGVEAEKADASNRPSIPAFIYKRFGG
jgi:hypothetical protein